MPIVFNFKICDNAPECNGIPACPVKAIIWNAKKQTLEVDNKKCISCGKCAAACPVKGAILVGPDIKKLREQVDEYPMTRAELLKERYGVMPTDPNLIVNMADFEEDVLKTDRIAVVDFWDEEHVGCRAHSLPFDEIAPKEIALRAAAGKKCVRFKIRKVNVKENPTIAKKFGITQIPSLLIFYNGNVIGRIDGAVPIEEKEKVKKKINSVISALARG